MSDPVCTEVEISATSAGHVQIVKFNLRNDFGLTYSEKYTIPSDWSEERLETWRQTKTDALKAKVEAYAQVEQDALLAASDWYDTPS